MSETEYFIGQIAEITGVSQKCIRAWEKYLGNVKRIPCGKTSYRLYTQEQLELVNMIQIHLKKGYKLQFAINKAKELLTV